jgi:osmotically-inducible protein OsmY
VRRLLGLVVLAVLVLVVYHYWKGRPPGAPALGEAARELRSDARDLRSGARELGRDAREFGAEAKEKLGEVGAEAKEKLGEVGKDLRDTKITASVKTALSLNRSLSPYSIDVSTEGRVVTLRGRVDRQDVRARIEQLAAEVPDVERVLNQLEVGRESERTAGASLEDQALAAQRALQANSNLRAFDLRVQVEADRLVLRGQVRTPAEKDLAGVLARDAAGGSVENRVEIRPGAR